MTLLYCTGRQVRDVHAAEAGTSPENFRREDAGMFDKETPHAPLEIWKQLNLLAENLGLMFAATPPPP